MGILKAFADSLTGSFADQWKELITAGNFDELTVVAPGLLKSKNNGRGSNTKGSDGVISNGSIIFVPENTAAFIFSQGGIENVITKPGGYEYQDGEKSFFNGDGLISSVAGQVGSRIGYGGISSTEKRIAFVNLREIRGVLFGTQSPQVYHDIYYDADLEIVSHGSFSIKIVDVEKFVRNYLPPNTINYTFEDAEAKSQLMSEFVLSLIVVLNNLSKDYRISQLPSKANVICSQIIEDVKNVGSWEDRYGIKIERVAIESIEFTPESKELVNSYNSNKMNVKAYENVSQKLSNIAAQQKIAEGIKDKGLGDGGAGMVFGMNMAQQLNPDGSFKNHNMDIDKQVDAVKKLKELLDSGILTQEEFETKKKEIMGL